MTKLKNKIEIAKEPVLNVPLDTLAQLRKPHKNQPLQKLKKRALSKYISNNLALKLKDCKSDLEKSYFRTYGCASVLLQKDNKLTGKYCNNRWCLVCNRIRTAKLIKGYRNPLEELEDSYFITLTTPNVTADDLRGHIKYMISVFKKIKDTARKAGKPIKGIRKIECTYNQSRNNYNPHFHLIVSGKEIAKEIKTQWIQRIEGSNVQAQDVTKADDNSIYELFKYFTKLHYKDGTQVQALDVIFNAMYGLRTFQAMGIKKISEDVEEIQAEIFEEIDTREKLWLWVENDWVDFQTGEYLTGFTPNDNHKIIIESFRLGKSNKNINNVIDVFNSG